MKETLNFLNFLYKDYTYETLYFCIATKVKEFHMEWFKTTEIGKAIYYIQNNTDKSIYTSLNAFTKTKREKQYCVNYTDKLFLDFDDHTAFINFYNIYKNKITIVKTSKYKFQAILKLQQKIHKDQAELLSLKLARKYHADHAHDCTRVIRVPNTLNHKYDPPYLTKSSLCDYKFHVSEILQDTKDVNIETNTVTQKQNFINTNLKTKIEPHMITYAKKVYNRILESTPLKADQSCKDYSIANARFVAYLLSQGFSKEQIASLLYHVSPNLHERKGNYINTYILRTVNSVLSYVNA